MLHSWKFQEGQGGQGLEQPGLVEDVHAHSEVWELGPARSLNPFQPKPFYESTPSVKFTDKPPYFVQSLCLKKNAKFDSGSIYLGENKN